jgi:hypothetical protein
MNPMYLLPSLAYDLDVEPMEPVEEPVISASLYSMYHKALSANPRALELFMLPFEYNENPLYYDLKEISRTHFPLELTSFDVVTTLHEECEECERESNHHKNVVVYMETSFFRKDLQRIVNWCKKFETVYVTKPSSNNPASLAKYLVCKQRRPYYKEDKDKEDKDKEDKDNRNNMNIPSYFLKRLEEINMILGQQSMECLDQAMNPGKWESIRKSSWGAMSTWLEKFG